MLGNILTNTSVLLLLQVRYLMRGINGEVKIFECWKMLIVSSLCRVKCKLHLRSKTRGERDYKKCH